MTENIDLMLYKFIKININRNLWYSEIIIFELAEERQNRAKRKRTRTKKVSNQLRTDSRQSDHPFDKKLRAQKLNVQLDAGITVQWEITTEMSSD